MLSGAKTRLRSLFASNRANMVLNAALLLSALIFFAVMRYPIFKPALYTTQYTFDLGTPPPNSELHKTFTVRNLHPWSVTITGIEGSCGCTKPFLNRSIPFVLQPLDTVTASVQIEMPEKEGRLEQRVIITTFDHTSDTHFLLRANVAR